MQPDAKSDAGLYNLVAAERRLGNQFLKSGFRIRAAF
jgi:hypothetical protein